MKIGDVTVGEEYGAHDSPTGYRYGQLPRQVKALEIVQEEQHRYRSSYVAGASHSRKIRKVKVEVLDGSKTETSSYRNPIASAAKGAVLTIEAKFLLSPWALIRDDVKKEIEERAELEAAEKALEDRVARLVKAGADKNLRRREFYVLPDVRRYSGKLSEELRVEGEAVDWLLALAEAGLAARGS